MNVRVAERVAERATERLKTYNLRHCESLRKSLKFLELIASTHRPPKRQILKVGIWKIEKNWL